MIKYIKFNYKNLVTKIYSANFISYKSVLNIYYIFFKVIRFFYSITGINSI